jgi:hypothetical protein
MIESMRTKPLDSEPAYEEMDLKSMVNGRFTLRIKSVMNINSPSSSPAAAVCLSPG